jgi:hypothetical protein
MTEYVLDVGPDNNCSYDSSKKFESEIVFMLNEEVEQPN